jgi:hypothetical protein
VDFSLTDEQRHFVEAIRDFCRRETGTSEQRERLTNGYTEAHSAEIYSKMADPGANGCRALLIPHSAPRPKRTGR